MRSSNLGTLRNSNPQWASKRRQRRSKQTIRKITTPSKARRLEQRPLIATPDVGVAVAAAAVAVDFKTRAGAQAPLSRRQSRRSPEKFWVPQRNPPFFPGNHSPNIDAQE